MDRGEEEQEEKEDQEEGKQGLHYLAGYGHCLSYVPGLHKWDLTLLDVARGVGSDSILALLIPNAECPDRTWLLRWLGLGQMLDNDVGGAAERLRVSERLFGFSLIRSSVFGHRQRRGQRFFLSQHTEEDNTVGLLSGRRIRRAEKRNTGKLSLRTSTVRLSYVQSCHFPTVATGSRSVFQNLRNCAPGSARWDVRRSTMMHSGVNLCIGIQVEYL